MTQIQMTTSLTLLNSTRESRSAHQCLGKKDSRRNSATKPRHLVGDTSNGKVITQDAIAGRRRSSDGLVSVSTTEKTQSEESDRENVFEPVVIDLTTEDSSALESTAPSSITQATTMTATRRLFGDTMKRQRSDPSSDSTQMLTQLISFALLNLLKQRGSGDESEQGPTPGANSHEIVGDADWLSDKRIEDGQWGCEDDDNQSDESSEWEFENDPLLHQFVPRPLPREELSSPSETSNRILIPREPLTLDLYSEGGCVSEDESCNGPAQDLGTCGSNSNTVMHIILSSPSSVRSAQSSVETLSAEADKSMEVAEECCQVHHLALRKVEVHLHDASVAAEATADSSYAEMNSTNSLSKTSRPTISSQVDMARVDKIDPEKTNSTAKSIAPRASIPSTTGSGTISTSKPPIPPIIIVRTAENDRCEASLSGGPAVSQLRVQTRVPATMTTTLGSRASTGQYSASITSEAEWNAPPGGQCRDAQPSSELSRRSSFRQVVSARSALRRMKSTWRGEKTVFEETRESEERVSIHRLRTPSGPVSQAVGDTAERDLLSLLNDQSLTIHAPSPEANEWFDNVREAVADEAEHQRMMHGSISDLRMSLRESNVGMIPPNNYTEALLALEGPVTRKGVAFFVVARMGDEQFRVSMRGYLRRRMTYKLWRDPKEVPYREDEALARILSEQRLWMQPGHRVWIVSRDRRASGEKYQVFKRPMSDLEEKSRSSILRRMKPLTTTLAEYIDELNVNYNLSLRLERMSDLPSSSI